MHASKVYICKSHALNASQLHQAMRELEVSADSNLSRAVCLETVSWDQMRGVPNAEDRSKGVYLKASLRRIGHSCSAVFLVGARFVLTFFSLALPPTASDKIFYNTAVFPFSVSLTSFFLVVSFSLAV